MLDQKFFLTKFQDQEKRVSVWRTQVEQYLKCAEALILTKQ
jgi:hypothetical protein